MFRKILLIDDDEASNFLSDTILRDMDAAPEIDIAEDGPTACHILGQGSCPDIIFLDIRMPQMDGFNFLDRLKNMGSCPNTKVVMLTSSSRREDKEKAFTYMNVLDYFEKPLTEEIVRKVSDEYHLGDR
jgi:CheY-like chemotaxis protein